MRADSLYRSGLVGVMRDAGREVCTADRPEEIQKSDQSVGCLIVGDQKGVPITRIVLTGIEKLRPEVVVVITDALNFSSLEKLESLRVNAILSIEIKSSELIRALELLPGHKIINTKIVVSNAETATHLTDREWEVVELVSAGNSTREIARVLGISPKTVELHRYKLMKKLEIHNRAQLAVWYSKNKHHRILDRNSGV